MNNFLFALLFFFLYSFQGYSAVVTKISKKRRTLVIDEGRSTGFKKGEKVCVFRGERKVACGYVTKAKKSKALIKIRSRKSLRRIRKGYSVQLLSDISLAESTSKKVLSSFRVNYLPTIISPSSFNFLSYKTNPNGDNSTLWNEETTKSMTIVGLGLSYEYGLSPFSSIDIGLTYKINNEPSKENSFETSYTTLQERYTLASTLTTAVGFYLDYSFDWGLSNHSRFQLPMGLGIESETLKSTTTTKSDSGNYPEELIADVTSSIMTTILRLGSHYEYSIGSFGFRFGLTLGVPISGESSISGKVSSPEGGSEEVQLKDFEEKLAHSKSSFSLEVPMSLQYQF